MEPKGHRKVPQGTPKETQWLPKGAKGDQKSAQKTQSPDPVFDPMAQDAPGYPQGCPGDPKAFKTSVFL